MKKQLFIDIKIKMQYNIVIKRNETDVLIMKSTYWQRLWEILCFDRAAVRLIASWCSLAATLLLFNWQDFSVLEYAQGVSLLTVLLVTLLFFAVYTLIAAALGKDLHSDSWFLFASATVCVFRWLLGYDGTNAPLFWLAIVAAYSLFTVACVRINANLFSKWQPNDKTVTALAILFGIASCAVIAVITCLRYKTFSSPNYDFGLFCNMFYNMRESGLPLVTSERDQLLSHFAVHISPIYYLLLPFYYIFPSPMTLQIGQAVALSLGVIPVVLLARHHKLSGKTTLLVSALFAAYPALTTGCFYDIHENCFLPLFLLLTFLFYEKKKYPLMYLSALCVLAVKEDAAVYLLLFALFVLLSERNYLHGGLLAALSVGYFGVCAYVLQKYGLGMMVNRFDNLIYNTEDGLLGAVKTALVNPGFLLTQLFTTGKGSWEKLVYFLQMLLPLGFLPFCTKKPSRWLLVAPILINLLTYYQYQYDIGFQYHFGITAFLVYAMIKNLPELSLPSRQTLLSIAAAACCCIYVFSVIPKLNTYTRRWESGKATYRYMENILDTIPEDASINVSTFLLAHVADRDVVYEVGYHDNKPDVDYVILDLRYSSYQKALDAYLAHGYTLYAEYEGLILILQK